MVLLVSASATAARAGDFTVDVRDAAGRPLAAAVVTVTMPGVGPPPLRGPYVVTQQNISFEPHLLVVPVGADVSFPNRDRVRHHVYSFSKAKRFDLKLYGREEERSVTFDKPGVVALGCNIHDRMSGVVFVTATRFTAVTDSNGRASFTGVPPGRAAVGAWHSSMRAPGSQVQPVDVPAAAGGTIVVLRQ